MKTKSFASIFFKKTLFLSLIFLLFHTESYSQPMFSTDFESNSVGTPYTRPVWHAKGFMPGEWDDFLKERTEIDTMYSVSGNKSLKITYPKGGFGPRETGTQVLLMLPPRDEYYISYNFRFSKNFSWGNAHQGGKLPGICAGEMCDNTGSGFICDGTTGFYSLFMWRMGGKAELYLLNVDKVSNYGDDYDLVYPNGEIVYFEKGNWYHMTQRVKLNTGPDNYDGIIQVWVDGKQVLLLDNIRLVTNNDKIDIFNFVTFHGGATKQWAPTETCYSWFDDVKISTRMEDVEYKKE